MAAKKNSYVSAELDWAEEQLKTWKEFVDSHPINELKDRIQNKMTANGGIIPMVVASIEQQGKFIQETMKNYLALLEVVDRLREKEDAKKEGRGGEDIPYSMKDL